MAKRTSTKPRSGLHRATVMSGHFRYPMQITIHDAMAAQRRFFHEGTTRAVRLRQDRLRALGARIQDWTDRILAALEADLGKPRFEAYLSEIHFSLQEIAYTARRLKRWARPKRVASNLYNFPARCEIRPEPYGLALILGPWNYPFQLVLGPLISAIAAGNCAIIKPSEHAPATAELLRELVAACFDPGHVSVIQGGAGVAQELLQQRFDHVFYTGNARVGRSVMEACARHLTPLTLELGGKCPCIVDHRVALEQTVERIARGKFFNAGQTCVAPDYVCVHESIADRFVELLHETIRRFYGEEPAQSPDYGRIINAGHFDRLLGLLPDRGWSLGRHDRAGLFFAPTVLSDVDWDDKVMADEIFGPILPCLVYDELDAVLAEIRHRPEALALYVFSRDRAFQERCLQSIPSGGACLNDVMMHITPLTLPFGGVGQSGMGRYHGRFGFDTFSQARSVVRRPFGFDPFAVVPPYGSALARIRPFLARWYHR
jgi:aldehyde dehydrogenase (NAD+)